MTIADGKIVSATLLIVDDDKDIRTALAQGLTLYGIELQVYTAHNAVSAIQIARTHKPDVMVIDYGMPMGDGFALAKEIRSISSLTDTKLLMLTAQDTPDKAWESVEYDIDAFMGKPFNMDDVEAHIYSLLGKTLDAQRSS